MYIDCETAHQNLYSKAGILHRDISLNNLMVDPSVPTSGVLIDLDMAAQVKPHSGKPLEVVPILTGTTPFLAIDLLGDTPPSKAYYRHDLESFLYVLGWISVTYNLGVKQPSDHFAAWCSGSWADIAEHKLHWLSLPCTDNATEQFAPLQPTWLLGLRKLFHDGYTAQKLYQAGLPGNLESFDYETLGGYVTYEKFLAVLQGG